MRKNNIMAPLKGAIFIFISICIYKRINLTLNIVCVKILWIMSKNNK